LEGCCCFYADTRRSLLHFRSTSTFQKRICVRRIVSVDFERVHSITGIVYVEFVLSSLVLLSRAYAVWGESKKILYLLIFVYTAGITGTSYSVYLFIKGVSSPDISTPIGCPLQIVNNDLLIALAVLIFLESLALGLLLMKSIEHWRDLNKFDRSYSDYSRPSVLMAMARTGIGYFACTLVITIANLVVLKAVTPFLQDFLLVTQGAMQNILCSRLLFHVRAVSDSSVNTPAGQTSCGSWSTPAFRTASLECSDDCSHSDTSECCCRAPWSGELESGVFS